MVLLAIVSLSLSSNKLGNNFKCDTNLLMAMPSLLISNKKYYSCTSTILVVVWLIAITFDIVRG